VDDHGLIDLDIPRGAIFTLMLITQGRFGALHWKAFETPLADKKGINATAMLMFLWTKHCLASSSIFSGRPGLEMHVPFCTRAFSGRF